MQEKNILYTITSILVLLGALNWGVIGVMGMEYNIVAMLFDTMPNTARAIYVLIGVSGLLFATCQCPVKIK